MSEEATYSAEQRPAPRRARVRRRAAAVRPSWRSIVSPSAAIKIVIIGVLFSLVFRHEYYLVFYKWTHDGNWSHGFLIPLFSLYFLDQRREQLARVQFKRNYLGLLLVIASVVGYLVSIYPLKMGYPKLMALLLGIFGIVLFLCGWETIRITWLPILFLFFALPIPKRWYVYLTMPMRRWASTIAAGFLDLLPGIDANAMGVVIEGLYKEQMFTLNVAEACAGMRLMMAFFALGVAMAYLSDRPLWHRLVLVASTLPIALFCNFTRVIVTGLIYVLIDPQYSQGPYHTLLGLSMLPLAFGLYGVIALALNRVFVEEPLEAES